MNRLNFLIDWFHKENERQIAINDSLNIPIGILTGIFAMIFYMFTSFSFAQESNFILRISFISLIILSLIFWIIVVYFLFKSYNNLFHTYEYKAMPFPTELNIHYENLAVYVNENKGLLDDSITVNSLYDNQLIDMLSEYLNRNIENNDRKSSYLHIAKKYLLVCIISVIFCAVPFTIQFVLKKEIEQINKIETNTLPQTPERITNLNISTFKIDNYEQKRQDTTKDSPSS